MLPVAPCLQSLQFVKGSQQRSGELRGYRAGISEELEPMEIDRLLVGKVIFRGGRV